MPMTEKRLYALMAGLAAAVWVVPWALLSGREAWDHSSYFTLSLPAMSAAAAYAGFRAKSRWWRWPVTLAAVQFATALLLKGFGNLLPLGAIAFAILAVPMAIAAAIGSRIARFRERQAS